MDVLNLGLLMSALHLVEDVIGANDEVTEPCMSSMTKLDIYTTPLEQLEIRLPAGERFNLKPICRLYGDYTSCMKTHQENITQEIQQRQQKFDAVFHPLCKDHYKNYMSHYDCYRRMRRNYSSCRRKRQNKLPLGARTPRGHFWCRITNDYVTCMYTVTALACTMDAAQTYLVLVNNTLTSLPHTGPVCYLKNPLDILETSPAPSPQTSPQYLLRDNSGYAGRYPAARSNSHSLSRKHYYFISCFALAMIIHFIRQ